MWIILYIVTPFICFILIPHKNSTGTIYSVSNYSKFDNDQNITVFTHLTDMHINTKSERQDIFNHSLQIVNQIKPDFNLITGDLADNFNGDKTPRYGNQIPEHYDEYLKLTKYISDYENVEVDGNHDLFGVYSYEDKRKRPEDQNRTQSEYMVSVNTFLVGNKNYSVLSMNPYNFPSPHPPFIFYVHPSKEFVNQLENALSSIPEENVIIAISHHPMYQWFSGNRKFHKLMKNGKIRLFLNGHLHTEKHQIQHHKQDKKNTLLEIVGSDLTSHRKMAVGIFDNGRFSYHSISVDDDTEKLAFVTHPVSRELLSSHEIFSETESSIRVVSYQKSEPKITVSGAVNGDLDCEFRGNYYICNKSYSLRYGDYSIEFSGDLTETVDFTIGDQIPSYKEDVYQSFTSQPIFYFVLLGLVFAFLAFIIVPFHISREFEDQYSLWMSGVNQSSCKMWLISIFCGFVCVKMRISMIPRFIKYSLLAALIWPLLFPMIWIDIDNHFGFVWTWGYICNSIKYGVWGQYITLMYLALILLPITILCSMVYANNQCHWIFIIDALFPIFGLIANVYLILRFCYEASGIKSLLSPPFVLFPLYFYISIIIWKFCYKKGFRDDNNLVITQALL